MMQVYKLLDRVNIVYICGLRAVYVDELLICLYRDASMMMLKQGPPPPFSQREFYSLLYPSKVLQC